MCIFAVFADSHDAVLRISGAETSGYEADVGAKTTIRVINHMVVHFNGTGFHPSEDGRIFRNCSLLLVEPVCEAMYRDYLDVSKSKLYNEPKSFIVIKILS